MATEENLPNEQLRRARSLDHFASLEATPSPNNVAEQT
jgi:hypothetical protein